jgi:hypothetical protein
MPGCQHQPGYIFSTPVTVNLSSAIQASIWLLNAFWPLFMLPIGSTVGVTLLVWVVQEIQELEF